MICSMPGLRVHHHLPEFTQTHIHWVGDTIQPSHPLPSIFPRRNPSPKFLLFTYSFFSESVLCIRWPKFGASASASVLLMNIQDGFPLQLTGLILQFKGLSRVFSNTTVQKHQFFGFQPSLWSNSHILTWLLEKPYLWLDGPLLAK